jgi:hypothetical protein
MAKKSVPDAQDLDLTPIMNMVMVLIPMVMLNVVFTAITVIDVTMPQRSAGSAQQDGEPPKRIQLFITKQGFTIVQGIMTLSSTDPNCKSGQTICLAENADSAGIETDKYDWLALYNRLMDIKGDDGYEDHEQIEIVADSTINFGVLVKAMDISRFQLKKKSEADKKTGSTFASVEELNDSTPVMENVEANAVAAKPLFPVVILGMPTVSN